MKKVLLVLTLSLLTIFAHARKFYFSSSSGNDSYTTDQAQNINTPWQSTTKISYLVTKRGQYIVGFSFQPGDTLAFKRGDVFANGLNSYPSWFSAVVWWNSNDNYYVAPSGTPSAPIVFTNYGDITQPLPNFLWPLSTAVPQKFRTIFSFSGVHDIVVDGLQFNDTRFSYADKKTAALTYGGIELGQWGQGGASNPALRTPMVTNCVVKNCVFSNMSFGFSGVAAINSKITNNVFTNFKGTTDTIGFTDVLGGAIEGLSGFNLEISNNFIKGAWSASGRVSDCNGLGGIALDWFWCLKNSKIVYNTFVDCSGVIEMGNRDNTDTANGAQYDTVAYNKVINCGQLAYLHGSYGDVFAANNHHLYFWNNVVISNNKDRMNGNGFGDDIYGDGQGFSQFWFFRNKYKCPDAFVVKGGTVQGSTTVTFTSTAGLQVGTRLYDDDEVAYRTITNIGSGQVTVDAPMSTTVILNPSTGTGYVFRAYAPESDLSWSYPTNPALCNYGGFRSVIQYPSDSSKWGLWADTMIDLRNNIFYSTSGGEMLYPAKHGWSNNNTTNWKNRYFHRNNIYYIKGGVGSNLTALGGVLNIATGQVEYQTQTKLFVDTSSAFPENWDLHLVPGSLGVGAGTTISGLNKDFAGVTLSGTMDIGLYKYSATPIGVLVSSTNVTCRTGNNGSFTISASGGTAPYTYKVNNSAYTSTTTYSNLAPATYTVTVKDAKGLLSTLNVTIKSSSVTCP
jgi:hypothetical protein